MSSSSSSGDSDYDEETVSSLEISDYQEEESGSEEDSSEEETEEDETEEDETEEDGTEDSSSSGGSFAGSDKSEESPKLKSAMKKSSMKKPSVKESKDAAPPGISSDAYKTFFSKPLDDSPQKDTKKTRGVQRNPSLEYADLALKHAQSELAKRKSELDSSQHSFKSQEELIEKMNQDLLEGMDDEEPEIVGDINIAEASKNYKDMPQKDRPRTQISAMRDKREQRLAKVRDRIRAKEEAKEQAEDAKKLKEFETKLNGGNGFDSSESARRDRAYGWYTRMAMPSKEEMKERVASMPSSSGVEVEDVDLLPWAASGRMVNVTKMQKFINEGFKKKFTSRRKKKDDDSD